MPSSPSPGPSRRRHSRHSPRPRSRSHSGSQSRDNSSSPTRRHRSRSPPRRGSSQASHRSSSSRGRDSDTIDYKAAFFALQASNQVEAQKKRKRGSEKDAADATTGARGLRMLCALFGEIPTIITEAESYLVKGRYAEGDVDEFSPNLTPEQEEQLTVERECERNLIAYQQIMRLVPALGEKLSAEDGAGDLVLFYTAIQKAANDSRSEDFGRITRALGVWINADRDRPDIAVFDHTPPIVDEEGKTIRQYAPLLFDDRINRGPDHDVCGGLLSCIEKNWASAVVRTSLRDTQLLNESFYCRIFYRDFQGDPDNVDDGFLQSRYLVKGYKICFTGPKSAKDNNENDPAHKKAKSIVARAIRKPPAEILLMNGKVTPRSIAYIAIHEHMGLTNAHQWTPCLLRLLLPADVQFYRRLLRGPAGRNTAPKACGQSSGVVEPVRDPFLSFILPITAGDRQIFPTHASSASTAHTSVNSMAKLRAQRQRRAELEAL
ncbi:Alpha beta-hydrolase [Mycena venus]|uniref:Alpha beta-hydrolase n=1 Tax=Mycena venus TaxID=2733690 RepID=A0A8H7D3I0_9AGAR|nr:Alpha beta-hydrolase [Mycena venus]